MIMLLRASRYQLSMNAFFVLFSSVRTKHALQTSEKELYHIYALTLQCKAGRYCLIVQMPLIYYICYKNDSRFHSPPLLPATDCTTMPIKSFLIRASRTSFIRTSPFSKISHPSISIFQLFPLTRTYRKPVRWNIFFT